MSPDNDTCVQLGLEYMCPHTPVLAQKGYRLSMTSVGRNTS